MMTTKKKQRLIKKAQVARAKIQDIRTELANDYAELWGETCSIQDQIEGLERKLEELK